MSSPQITRIYSACRQTCLCSLIGLLRHSAVPTQRKHVGCGAVSLTANAQDNNKHQVRKQNWVLPSSLALNRAAGTAAGGARTAAEPSVTGAGPSPEKMRQQVKTHPQMSFSGDTFHRTVAEMRRGKELSCE